MRLFITDSGDFARDALSTRLEAEHSVTNEQRPSQEAVPWSDPDRIARDLEGHDCVIHFSRPIPTRSTPSEEKWRLVAGTENLLNASLAIGVRRFVLISTADISLHRAERINWNELREPPRERVVGAVTRLTRLAEEITLGFNLRGLQTIALRPAWLWGPNMPDPRSQAEQQEKRGLRLVGNGENYVATTHIDNLTRAASLAVATHEEGVGHAYYVCDNEMLTAEEFFSEVSRALSLPAPEPGPRLRWSYARAMLEELRRGPDLWRVDVIRRGLSTVFDTLSAHKNLGWSPAVSFRKGIAAMSPELRLVTPSP